MTESMTPAEKAVVDAALAWRALKPSASESSVTLVAACDALVGEQAATPAHTDDFDLDPVRMDHRNGVHINHVPLGGCELCEAERLESERQ